MEGDAQLAYWHSEDNVKEWVVSLHSDGPCHRSWWQVLFTLSPLVFLIEAEDVAESEGCSASIHEPLGSPFRTAVKPGRHLSQPTQDCLQNLFLLDNFLSPKYSATENNAKQVIPPLPRHREDLLQGCNEWAHP